MSLQIDSATSEKLKGLPRGIIQDNSDLELRPLWSRSNSRSKVRNFALFFDIILVLLKLHRANKSNEFLMVIMKLQFRDFSNRNLLAIPVGIKQKHNVDAMVQKVLFIDYLSYPSYSYQQYSILYLISFISVSSRKFYNYFIPL